MHIRCPHCHNPIEVVDEVSLNEVDCPSCGSSFSLVNEETATADWKGQDLVNADTPSHRQADRLIGHFRLVRQLGAGAFGAVWQAHDTQLDRQVAVKIPRRGQLSPTETEWFLREARSAAQLKHSHIVPVHEVGREAGQVYIVSDLIEGVTLEDRLEAGPLSTREAAELVATVAEAIQHAHEQGVVHRDLKPSNIMLDATGQPHVMDFGLAKRDAGEITMTVEGAILGTPAYMSPEQAKGEGRDADARSDVYSLGVILYECLSGERPFRGNKRMLLHQVINEDPPSPRKMDNAIPKDLETISLKCLRKEPDRRFASARLLAEDLTRWLHGEAVHSRPVSRAERAWLWCRRRPVVAILIGLIVMGTILASLAIYDRQNAASSMGLIDSLVSADMDEVPRISNEMRRYRLWAEPRLRARFAKAKADSDEKRRLRLAMLQFDGVEAMAVVDDLLEADLPSIAAIVESLEPHQHSVASRLWDVFHQTERAYDEKTRFHAGLALAYLAPDSDLWESSDYEMLSENLVVANPIHQGSLFRVLEAIRERMLPALEVVFSDRTREQGEQVGAANAIAYFAGQDAERLARLMLTASGAQYRILYEQYQDVVDTERKTASLALIKEQPSADLSVDARIELGKNRATAAITLLRQGERQTIFDVMRFQSDPEALTQFVHRCRTRDVTPVELISCLEIVDERRGPLDGDRHKTDDSVMYGLLLALGEFSWDELPEQKHALAARLGEIYEKDPSSGVHSATGWLLERWGQGDVVSRVNATPAPYDDTGRREWYVQEFEHPVRGPAGPTEKRAKFYLTFIVFPPSAFNMGLLIDVPHQGFEKAQHRVSLTRTIAVSDRELTWAQWTAMEGTGRREAFTRQYSRTLDDSDPVFGVTWFDGVAYCRWLTRQVGLSEADQCYENPDLLEKDHEGNPANWPLRLEAAGFRLPTEAEWEYISRSGTESAYSFGHDQDLLDRYAWYQKNSADWSHPTGALRPNSRGLFDVHGNLFEWCHDWFIEELTDGTDPVLDETNGIRTRAFRGGCWSFNAAHCGSWYRHGVNPNRQLINLGFRVAVAPSSREAEAKEQESE